MFMNKIAEFIKENRKAAGNNKNIMQAQKYSRDWILPRALY